MNVATIWAEKLKPYAFIWGIAALVGSATGSLAWFTLDYTMPSKQNSVVEEKQVVGNTGCITKWPQPYRPEAIVNKKFKNETVLLDGRHIADSTFENVLLEYNGTTAISFAHNRVNGYGITTKSHAVLGTVLLLDLMGALKRDKILNFDDLLSKFNHQQFIVVEPPTRPKPI